MSDATDDVDARGREALNQARLAPLRDRMRAFVDEREGRDLKDLRRAVSDGKPLSDVVIDDRNERV